MSLCAAESTRAFYTSVGWCSPMGLQSTFFVYCTTAENNLHSNMLCRSMAEQWAVYKGKNTVMKQKLAGGEETETSEFGTRWGAWEMCWLAVLSHRYLACAATKQTKERQEWTGRSQTHCMTGALELATAPHTSLQEGLKLRHNFL